MKLTRAQWVRYAREAARRQNNRQVQEALTMRMALGANAKDWQEYIDTLKG